jgi:hypothetical protein
MTHRIRSNSHLFLRFRSELSALKPLKTFDYRESNQLDLLPNGQRQLDVRMLLSPVYHNYDVHDWHFT